MEARSELRGARMSKGLVVVIAVCVTLGLGITAGVVAKNLSGMTATQTHIVKSQAGPADTYTFHRSGAQLDERIVVAPAKQLPGNAFVAPDAADRKAAVAQAPAEPDGLRNARGFRLVP